MNSIQERLLSVVPQINATSPQKLRQQILASLHRARGDGQLRPKDSLERLVLLDPPEKKLVDQRDHVLIGGGFKDMKRRPESARLIRSDRAWIHFSMTLRRHDNATLEMLGYDFELVFPPGRRPRWIRFDLNLPAHDNISRELRSHMHPGNADILVPTPVMTPLEILDLMLYRMAPNGARVPRVPTEDMTVGQRTRLLWSFFRPGTKSMGKT